MAHQFKTFDMKADETGKIAGFFSTYDKEPDSYGDIIEPGAFTDTLAKRAETGHPFPLCWNHDFSEVIGACDRIEDTEKGPYVEAPFLDTQKAQDVRKAVQSGAVWQYSFAYDVLDRRDPTAEEKAAGITNGQQVYDFIMAGSEAAGAASGIMNAKDPIAMIDEMIAAVRKAWDERNN